MSNCFDGFSKFIRRYSNSIFQGYNDLTDADQLNWITQKSFLG
jgi:hypothetical protein